MASNGPRNPPSENLTDNFAGECQVKEDHSTQLVDDRVGREWGKGGILTMHQFPPHWPQPSPYYNATPVSAAPAQYTQPPGEKSFVSQAGGARGADMIGTSCSASGSNKSGSSFGAKKNEKRRNNNTLVSFQRWISEGKKVDTTVNIKREDEAQSTMADIVKRLQGIKSGVLTFDRSELLAIKAGEKGIVFVLPQLGHAKFSKEEFGEMATSDFLELTQDRPIIIEITTEDAVSGETLDIF